MIETILIVTVVLIMALLSVNALRGRRDLRDIRRMLAEAQVTPERLLETFNEHLATLRHLSSLFRDDDYLWLRHEMGLAAAARDLKRRRIRLARDYLKLMQEDFNRLSAIHHLITPDGESVETVDQLAAMSLRFRYRIRLAHLLLPLNYVRLNLSPLADLNRALDTLTLRLNTQMDNPKH
jgi:hypothetical protein